MNININLLRIYAILSIGESTLMLVWCATAHPVPFIRIAYEIVYVTFFFGCNFLAIVETTVCEFVA